MLRKRQHTNSETKSACRVLAGYRRYWQTAESSGIRLPAAKTSLILNLSSGDGSTALYSARGESYSRILSAGDPIGISLGL